MTTFALIITLAAFGAQEAAQERPVPKDSVQLSVTGCLKGRILAVTSVRSEDTQSGPIVRAKSFRLTAKKDVISDIKREDRHLVDITGLVKKSALIEPGMKIGKGITIGGGSPTAGTGMRPTPSDYVPVLDVESIRLRATSCTGG